MNHVDRLIDVTRRHQEMLRDAALERRSMTVEQPRRLGRWIDRLLPDRTALAV